MRHVILGAFLLLPLLLQGQKPKGFDPIRAQNKEAANFTVGHGPARPKRYIHLQALIGGSSYFGDLAPSNRRGSTYFGYVRPAIGLACTYPVHRYVGIRGGLNWSRLKGADASVSRTANPTSDDIGRFTRNLAFRNDVLELALTGTFDLFPMPRDIRRRGWIRPYATAGLSLFAHNPETQAPGSSSWVRLQPLGTEGQWTGAPGTRKPYRLVQVGFPLGFGVRYRMSDRWDLQLEICYRLTLTDYLDDVSGAYPTDSVYGLMESSGNTLGIALSNRSASVDRDRSLRQWARQLPPSESVTLPAGYVMERVEGNRAGGAPRGHAQRDGWVVTAVHLSYALQLDRKRRTPR
jgi:hypothetical protein